MKLVSFRLLVFKAKSCGHCVQMQKARTIEKFVDKNYPPKIPVHWLDCMDEEGEAPAGTELEKHFKLSDSYGVSGFPTIVIEGKSPTGSTFEIGRADSETVSGFTAKELQRIFKEGLKEFEENFLDDMLTQDEAAKTIPW